MGDAAFDIVNENRTGLTLRVRGRRVFQSKCSPPVDVASYSSNIAQRKVAVRTPPNPASGVPLDHIPFLQAYPSFLCRVTDAECN